MNTKINKFTCVERYFVLNLMLWLVMVCAMPFQKIPFQITLCATFEAYYSTVQIMLCRFKTIVTIMALFKSFYFHPIAAYTNGACSQILRHYLQKTIAD